MDGNPVGECPFQRCSVLRSGDDTKLGPVATSAMPYDEQEVQPGMSFQSLMRSARAHFPSCGSTVCRGIWMVTQGLDCHLYHMTIKGQSSVQEPKDTLFSFGLVHQIHGTLVAARPSTACQRPTFRIS